MHITLSAIKAHIAAIVLTVEEGARGALHDLSTAFENLEEKAKAAPDALATFIKEHHYSRADVLAAIDTLDKQMDDAADQADAAAKRAADLAPAGDVGTSGTVLSETGQTANVNQMAAEGLAAKDPTAGTTHVDEAAPKGDEAAPKTDDNPEA